MCRVYTHRDNLPLLPLRSSHGFKCADGRCIIRGHLHTAITQWPVRLWGSRTQYRTLLSTSDLDVLLPGCHGSSLVLSRHYYLPKMAARHRGMLKHNAHFIHETILLGIDLQLSLTSAVLTGLSLTRTWVSSDSHEFKALLKVCVCMCVSIYIHMHVKTHGIWSVVHAKSKVENQQYLICLSKEKLRKLKLFTFLPYCQLLISTLVNARFWHPGLCH